MLICIQAIRNDADRSFVEGLYHSYGGTMLYIAQSILKDPSRAEDAVSMAFLKIIDKLQYFSFENCNKTRGLLGIVIRDICYDMLKSDKSRKNVSLDDAEESENVEEDVPLDMAISEESYHFLLDCLSHLKESYKDILRLKLFYEYTDEEISHLLELTPKNVRMRLYRAKKAMEAEILKRGNVDG